MNPNQLNSNDYGLLQPDAGPDFAQAENAKAEPLDRNDSLHDDENRDMPDLDTTPGQDVHPVDRQISIVNRAAG